MKPVKISKEKKKPIKNKYKRIQFKKNPYKYKSYFWRILIIIFSLLIILLLLYILKRIIFNHIDKGKMLKYKSDKGFEYFCCFCSMGRLENKYAKELIEYYMQLGVGKFILGDNNLPNEERLSEVLQDYIDKGIVDIIDLIGKPTPQGHFYGVMYDKYKSRCEWITFFDFDEYLEIHFEEGKTISLKEYLTSSIFNDCDSIAINWLMYTDNNLVYYDKRPLVERFKEPSYSNEANKFIKSIIRGNLTSSTFPPNMAFNHSPKGVSKKCDSMGQPINVGDNLTPPLFKYAYLKHFNTKTAEEYVYKILRGSAEYKPYDSIEGRVKLFFVHNKFTKEKLKVFEDKLNRTFPNFIA